jgi:hypothetical protein
MYDELRVHCYMKIAHIGSTSGVPMSLANEQVRRGNTAEVFAFSPLAHKKFGGTFVNFNKVSVSDDGKLRINPFFLWHRSKFFGKIKDFDIWHYHSPYGKLKEKLEKEKGNQRYIKHYHGTDLRHKYDSDFCLVSTPDLLQFAPKAKWLPNPLDLDFLSKFRRSNEKENSEPKLIRLAHYPFYKNRGHKLEYDHYVDTISYLENKSGCEVIEIHNIPYFEAIQKHSHCDITIGKIVPDIGWMGRFELEGMAMGKPVICYIEDELFDKYKPPVFRTTKETFRRDLDYLLQDTVTRRKLSEEASQYVCKNHDVKAVVNLLESYYRQI